MGRERCRDSRKYEFLIYYCISELLLADQDNATSSNAWVSQISIRPQGLDNVRLGCSVRVTHKRFKNKLKCPSESRGYAFEAGTLCAETRKAPGLDVVKSGCDGGLGM